MGQADRLAKRMTDAVLDRVASQSRPKVIVAYHGSPHSFDRFDAAKIGTGEGAQAYGYGHYFGGAEDTARHYRDALSDGSLIVEGATSPLTERSMRDMGLGLGAIGYIRRAVNEGADPVSRLRQVQSLYPPLSGRWNEMSDAIEFLQSAKGPLKPHGGHMYEVELGVPEEALLNLDATMTQQSPEVLRALGRYAEAPRHFTLGQEGWAGKNAYMAAAPLGFGDAMSVASRRLLDAGIPGLSYWDGNSRSAAEGTRNYVMFPGTEDRIRILRKYGLLGPAAAGMLGDEE